jgi:transcription elongation GreA/GreB family factor
MITAIERESEKKANKLRDFIIDDPDLVDRLTKTADLDVVKDITRAIQLSPSFEGMDKRSVLGKLVKSHPDIQTFISGEQSTREKDTALIVSWPSLERRKKEHEELVQRKIPANSKEIAIARSYGDLRENHEYKAAKEMQKLLMSRKGELEQDLDRARGTDFAGADPSQASIGTRVTVTNLGSNAREEFALLGAWDGDPDSNSISYLTPLGQALLNHKPGDEVTLDMEGDDRSYRVESITAYNTEAAMAPETAPTTAEPEPAIVGDEEPVAPSI